MLNGVVGQVFFFFKREAGFGVMPSLGGSEMGIRGRGYSLPEEVCQKPHLNKLRYYITAENVYLWSKRKGLDPRSSLAGVNSSAVYSPIRTVSMGLTLNF